MPETKQPTRLAPFRPPTIAEVAAFYRTGKWQAPTEADSDRVAEIRAAIADGTYETPHKLDVAVARMLPDIVEKGDLRDTLAKRMAEEAEDPERWDGQS
jgi:integral membrane sensor domain MASE1